MGISYRTRQLVSNRSFLSIRRPAINRTDRTLCAGAHNGRKEGREEPLRRREGWMEGEMVLAVTLAQLSPGASTCPRVRGSLSRSPWPASTGSTLHGLMSCGVSIRLWQAMRYSPSPPFAIAMQSSVLPGPLQGRSGARQAAGLAVVGRHPMPGQDRHFNSAPYPPIYKPLPSIFSPPCQSKPQLLAS